VQPQHVRESQYALTDTPLTFLVALTMLLSLRAAEDGRVRKFFWAGLAAGLAGATKYNGILAVIMPICAALAAGRGRPRWTAAFAAVGGGAAGFAIGEPYALLDLTGFLNGFATLMQAYNKPSDASDTFANYLTFIRQWFSWRTVLPGLSGYYSGLLGLWITAIGLMASASQVARQSMRAATLVLLPFPLIFLWFISHQSLQFGRYALPLVPMLCIVYAAGVVLIQRVVQRRTANRGWLRPLVTVLLLLPLGFQAATDAGSDWNRRRGRTVNQAGNWLLNNVDQKDPIVTEAEGMRLPPRFTLSDPPMHRIIDHPVDQYRADGFVYVVLSSSRFEPSERALPSDLARYQDLVNRTEVAKRFSLPGEPTITILKFVR
jgi:4-amino-4-deoxy-L-arabinose transferase-like glycosyltransferase